MITKPASFMASKSCKGKDSSKSGGGTGKKSLYECWRDDYNSNNYYYDEECEDLTEDQLAFRDAFDISLRGQIRRYEHVAIDLVRQLESGTSTSIFKYPALKQLAIKRGDEYGFVIRPCLVEVTFESMRIDL
ncbi:hypothetical protein Tco_0646039 [Tanacetum coccineum]